MRRIPAIGQQIAAHMRPIIQGKIDRASLGYTFSSDGWTNPQGVHFKSFVDDHGRDVSLFRRASVRCPLADPQRPVIRGMASVPLKVCRECPHHMKGDCCSILRDKAQERRP